jgi:hypothetical protein
MGALSRRTSRSTFDRMGFAMATCLIAAATAGACGFAAGFLARGESVSSNPAVISAADSIDLRFPAEWAESAMPASYAFASADTTLSLFDPTPVYPVSTETTSSVSAHSSLPPQSASLTQSVASAPGKLAAAVPGRPVHRSNAVLNESQIASIKRRLNLTPDQERYWPAVEAELRKMEYKKDPKSAHGTRTAGIDMSKVNVEGLKSAGLPLVMSFNDDQKQELRSLAHLLGLENVMATF